MRNEGLYFLVDLSKGLCSTIYKKASPEETPNYDLRINYLIWVISESLEILPLHSVIFIDTTNDERDKLLLLRIGLLYQMVRKVAGKFL